MTDLSGTEILSWKTGTAAAWTAANPVLEVSEPGVESDTRKWKLGDGTTHWIDLPYETGSTWADLQAAPDFPAFLAAGDTKPEARGVVDAVGTWAELEAVTDFPAALAAGDTPEEARTAIGALGVDDVPAVSGLDSLSDVSTAGGNPGDALIQNSDDTYSVQPVPEPVNFKPWITKEEGASTPGGTAPDTFVAVLAGVGSVWGYDTDAGAGGVSGTVQDCPIVLTQPVAIGDLLVIGVSADAAGGIQSAWSGDDPTANVFTQAIRHIQGNTNQTALIFCKATAALAVGDTVTVHSDVGRTQIAAKAAVVVGAAAAGSVLDKTASGGAASSASLLVGPSAATAQADEIAFAVFGYQSSGITFTPSNAWILAGAPKDSAATTARRGCVMEYKELTAIGTVSATGNTSLTSGGASQTVNYSGVLATFKRA